MSLRRQVTFWTIAILAFVLAVWLLRGVLLPFVAGMTLAYLLDPLANRLERAGLNRVLAALSIVGVFVVAFIVLAIVLAPILAAQLSGLLARLPGYVSRLEQLLTDPHRAWLSKLVGEGVADAQASSGELVKEGVGWLAVFLRSLWSGGEALISIFSLIVVTPIVAFYLISDWNRMLAVLDSLIPLPHRETVRMLALQINAVISGYFRGQTLVALALGVYFCLALAAIGLNFGLLVGIVSGLLTLIPYVGSLTGLVLGVGVAIAQFWPDYPRILLVLAVFLLGQFFEGHVLSPKLVGGRVGLHPLWLMFALLSFGYLFGFVGLLIAVPAAAVAGVLIRFAVRYYLASPLYTGADTRPELIEATRLELR